MAPPLTNSHGASGYDLTPRSRWSKAFWLDLLERVGSVFLYSLLTFFVTTQITEIRGVDFEQLWTVLFLPAVCSLIKGLLANMAAPQSGASLLPAPSGPVLKED